MEKEEKGHLGGNDAKCKGMEAQERSHAPAGTRASPRQPIDLSLTPLGKGEFEFETAATWSMV